MMEDTSYANSIESTERCHRRRGTLEMETATKDWSCSNLQARPEEKIAIAR